MAEEEIKKTKKPRVSKKAAAGTQRTEEKTENTIAKTPAAETEAVTEKPKKKTVRKTAKTAQEEVAVAETVQPEKAETEAKKVKKQSARKTAKKAEEPTKATKETAVQEKPAEEKTAKEQTAEEKPKAKKTTAKKTAESVVKEEPKKEKPKKEKPKKEEAKAPKPMKQEEKPATKAEPQQPKEEAPVKAEDKSAPKTKEKPVKAEDKSAPKAEEKPIKTEEKSAPKVEEKTVKTEENRPVTRAEKQAERTARFKPLVLEVLQGGACKRAALVQQAAEKYQQAYGSAEYGNEAGVKGMVGNVLDQMIADKEAFVDGKTVSLEKPAEKVQPEKVEKTQNAPTVSALNEEKAVEKTSAETAKKAVEAVAEKAAEKTAEQAKETAAEAPAEKTEAPKTQTALTKVEAATPAPVYDLSALFEKKKPAQKKDEKPEEPKKAVREVAKEKADELQKTKPAQSAQKVTLVPVKTEERAEKSEEKPVKKVALTEEKPVKKSEEKTAVKPQAQSRKEIPTRRPGRQAKVDPLKDAFLKKLRSLGGNYFEYYAIYLLERYSRMNGRRLEGLRVSGGEYDGGIDGELELTDRLGFRETIYVQAKNWEPTDEKWWIGETILQQFIGAVAYRQAKEGKQHCRGMFITTSAFTTGAKEMLDKMSDKFVGYDGDDLYETAKECQFGLIKDEKGNWKVDEELLSGNKSFFFML